MRFALLGDHPDGLNLALALSAGGRHEFAVFAGPARIAETLARSNVRPRVVSDLEETLADPAIDLVIVASVYSARPAVLKRSLQSERNVLVVHPAGPGADLAYEAGLQQSDTGKVLLSIRPAVAHPAILRLTELARAGLDARLFHPVATRPSAAGGGPSETPTGASVDPLVGVVDTTSLPAGFPRLVSLEIESQESALLESSSAEGKHGVPGWEILRMIGGEIVELSALSPAEEVVAGEPLVIAGRFLAGGMFHLAALPRQAEQTLRVRVLRSHGDLTLTFPEGLSGASTLEIRDAGVEPKTESFPAVDVWPAFADVIDHVLTGASGKDGAATTRLSWADETRALELNDAVRRSVERRRSSTLEMTESAEEASFKGSMTVLGCALVWIALLLLILSVWMPWLGWIILPAFALFLGLQALRWIIPDKK